MNTRPLFLASLAAAGVVAFAVSRSARRRIPQPATQRSDWDVLDTYIERERRRLNVPGIALAVVQGEHVVHRHGFGRARPRGEIPTAETPFVLGSLTKSFTALAVMQLAEAGKLELDAPVQRYLPWFRVADPIASAQITVRHLLNQTSGLPELPGLVALTDFDARADAAERQARALATINLAQPVGRKFEYSNVNYNLLGLVIQALSGETYADYLRKHILAPLEMCHTYTAQAEAKQHGLAIGHRIWFGVPVPAPNLKMPRGSLASGQLISTAEDMAHYLIAHLNGGRYREAQILSPAGIAELHRGVAEFGAMGIRLGKYGMGWFVSDSGPTPLIWHTGNVPDFSTYMAILPEQNQGIVLLLNAGHHMMVPVTAEFGMNVAQRLAGTPAEASPLGFVRLFPRALGLLLLVPILQLLVILGALRSNQRMPHNPAANLHSPISMLYSLLSILPLWLQRSGRFGYMRLFMPDVAWTVLVSGAVAGVWSVVQMVRAIEEWIAARAVTDTIAVK